MKNKAFTLIELLAVIVILGIIAVLITPKINNTLEEAEQNTNMTSAQNIVKAATMQAANNQMTGSNYSIIINYDTGTNLNYLEYTGKKPTNGQVIITSNGDIAMSVRFKNKCYSKEFNSSDITTITYNENTCGANSTVFTNSIVPELGLIPQLATTGDGLYEAQGESGRYVYRGANPNNYIWLDENQDGTKTTTELYRIVSYESDGTIKVVRNESIENIAWDNGTARQNTSAGYYCTSSNGCNVWGNMNNTYYDGQMLSPEFKYRYYPDNSAETLHEYTSKGIVSSDSTLNQYLNETWLTSALSNYIDNHNFNVGAVYYTSGYTGGDKGLQKEKTEENIYTWKGKVGLLNITEYAESSTNSLCTDVWSNYYNNPSNEANKTSNEWPCKYNNYNYKSGYHQWTLSPATTATFIVWYVKSTGYFSNLGYTNDSLGVRPAFYLKSSVILTGSGTEENPYTIENM